MAVQVHLEAIAGVRPGTAATVLATVRNASEVVETYHLEVVGAPSPWASIQPPAVSLLPGDAATATITFSVPTADLVPSGMVTWGLRARAETAPATSAVEEAVLSIEGVSVLACELLPETARGRRRTRHRVVIENRGNSPTEVSVMGRDTDEVLDVSVADGRFTLPPGGTREVGIKTTSSDRGRGHHAFSVRVADAAGEVTMLRGGFDQRPLSKAAWGIPLAAAVLVVAAVALNRPEEATSLRIGAGDPAAPPTTSAAPTPGGPAPAQGGAASNPGGGAPAPDSLVPSGPAPSQGASDPAGGGAISVPGSIPTPVFTAAPKPGSTLPVITVRPPTVTTVARPVTSTATTLPATTDASPCGAQTTRAGHLVQYCPLWRGDVPVYDSPDAGNGARRVDTLVVGGSANWFVGQSLRSAYTAGTLSNRWWAFTLGDKGAWGWVPQVFFTGGANNERDAGLFLCGTKGNTCTP